MAGPGGTGCHETDRTTQLHGGRCSTQLNASMRLRASAVALGRRSGAPTRKTTETAIQKGHHLPAVTTNVHGVANPVLPGSGRYAIGDEYGRIHGACRGRISTRLPRRGPEIRIHVDDIGSCIPEANRPRPSNRSRALRPNAAEVWGSGSLSSVGRSRCSATGSKSDRLRAKGRCFHLCPRRSAKRELRGSYYWAFRERPENHPENLYIGVIPYIRAPFMLTPRRNTGAYQTACGKSRTRSLSCTSSTTMLPCAARWRACLIWSGFRPRPMPRRRTSFRPISRTGLAVLCLMSDYPT